MEEKEKELELKERIIEIKRVTKVVAGGRRFSFSALVVVGDGAGRVGLGYGKANEVPEAIRKAIEKAKKNIVKVSLKGTTIPHDVVAKFKAVKVFMKPASPGTGLIAGGAVRAVLEMAGVKDVLTKSYGSRNPINAAKATLKALLMLKTSFEIAKMRGITLEKLWGKELREDVKEDVSNNA